ncbi:MAG: hypothetical protein OM95_08135 [Bdellovibrio sp. ArHS]|uniref:hypothetical protein n=1 Tax=Bdellovibrio sp. ArHS TaxID=1569284 RepID=UPI000583DF69|nr:hypothetical protein [Bdellovibrio sp. ArHS]KHD88602.1 MAG: hypothetical protein OM95_08135 [Bdellovibrio sp. ArHS]
MKITKIATAVMATLALGSTAMAASSGTLLLQGTVSVVNDIVVAANTANNTSLNITGGETGKNVATVTETSNNLNGYKIKISSPTGGELRHTTNSAQKTTYKIGYDGAASVTPTVAGVVVKNVTALTGLTTDTSEVAVDVTAYANAAAGTYQDTLTIAIEAN